MIASSSAEDLLHKAIAERDKDWLTASLLTAAAVALVLPEDPIVVGGTAEAYWTGRDVYHPTDLDLWMAGSVAPASRAGKALKALGFGRRGMHWVHPDLPVVPIEFPSGEFAGSPDLAQAVEVVAGAHVRTIGLDDLYLDRLRQATANEDEGSVEFKSALSVATHRFDSLDWGYIRRQIGEQRQQSEMVARAMARTNRRIRGLVRRGLASSSPAPTG